MRLILFISLIVLSAPLLIGQSYRAIYIDAPNGNVASVNNSNELLVHDQDIVAAIQELGTGGDGVGVVPANIKKQNEVSVASRNETDLATTTYTVPAGKVFKINSFSGSYDAQALMYVRLKKQTGGEGGWTTLYRGTMMNGGQGDAIFAYAFAQGVLVGAAGDVFKITYEGSIAKGTIFAEYSGTEYQ